MSHDTNLQWGLPLALNYCLDILICSEQYKAWPEFVCSEDFFFLLVGCLACSLGQLPGFLGQLPKLNRTNRVPIYTLNHGKSREQVVVDAWWSKSSCHLLVHSLSFLFDQHRKRRVPIRNRRSLCDKVQWCTTLDLNYWAGMHKDI